MEKSLWEDTLRLDTVISPILFHDWHPQMCAETGHNSIIVQIPAMLRPECGGQSELAITASTVRGALERLEQNHPKLYRSVCDETGAVRRHMNLFVNSSHLAQPDGLDRSLQPGDVLFIMTAVSGG